ncbi:kelch repeat-containing protein [Larkinella soli]|uniref:kelch repeat-containing protein n=1 Tax=Larkinella soli TaxID=1770527 RepID=UPI000FFC4CF8|nr:kelch repeat-containing protein [Larkinella soli]
MNTLTHCFPSLRWIIPAMLVAGCRTGGELVPIRSPDPVTAAQASLVSILAIGPTSAEVIVKSIRLEAAGWRLTARSPEGSTLPIPSGETTDLKEFRLTTLRLDGLVGGQTYQFRLAFRFAEQDSITAIRSYTHRLSTSPHWTRLAHAAFSGGDYTACPVAVDGICGSNPDNGCGHPGIGAYVGNRVQLLRYAGPQQDRLDTRIYDRATDSWPFFAGGENRTPRQGMIQYNLFHFKGVDRYQFSGLGYITEERAPGKYFYYHDMSVQLPVGGSPVYPLYGGEDGEVAFFMTTDEAYFLTQNGSPAMRSIHATFTQTVRAPLPEPPGTLATFSIRNIGYVVNQRPGLPTRLWAYDPAIDVWTRRADFPGPSRRRGTAFSLARNGYFGLGLTPDGQGLRDLWRYDPGTDRWQYVTEYPGQGNQLLAVFSAPDGAKPQRAYLGWGYEAQRTGTGVNRIVGCTDWWELTP